MAVQKQSRISVVPIGVVHSEHVKAEETPIQPCFARGCKGEVEIFPEYAEGLKDVEGFSHLFLIYSLHQAGPALLTVTPFLDDQPRGVFSTRYPRRPNHLGLSLVRLERREGNKLFVIDVDILDGTPLLDIKPFRPQFDVVTKARAGWMENIKPKQARVRGRRGYRGQGRPPGPKAVIDVSASTENEKE
jgi:tRNA (adenine37-N6)-methyltransferase